MPIKKLITSSILLVILTGCYNNASSLDNPNIPSENSQVITPKINNGILINPDIGFTDFSSIDIRNDPYSAEPSYPETSIVYFRWYWEQLEPQEGQYNFTLINNVLKEAKKHNKKLVFRIMTLAEPEERYYSDPIFESKKILGVPCWLKTRLDSTNSAGQDEGCSSNSDFIPDYNQPLFQNKISQLMQALGKQYDGNDNILRIDVGIIGTWGEWHMAGRTIHTPN
ncbi:beta-galactosidase [Photobacterium damselae]|uniref:beta-galactosidase n=1 Tax=Photobacterium damselae TaxID=38293 RepID=UPI003D7CBBA7